MNGVFKKIVGFVASVVLLLGVAVSLSACGDNQTAAKGSKDNPIKFGVVGLADEQWTILKEDLEKEGIYVEYSNFTDYTQGLIALSEGSLDINQSVHAFLLSNYNVKNGYAAGNDKYLRAIGSKAVFPLGMYPNISRGVKSIDDIRQGDTVVIPNDASNTARALLELQDAGLVVLKDGGSPLSTLTDIDSDASKVNVKTVDAGQVPPLLSDPQIVAGITNNDHIRSIGIQPSESIYLADPSSEASKVYTNVFAVRASDTDNELYKKIVRIASNDKRWLDEVVLESAGTAVVTVDTVSPEDLSVLQDKIEANIRAKN
ncbi:MAG: ABC transporter substrate-binding protein [Candidatus Ancillula sp.]|jgi:D-methionine transport system substrate-binding protein|nr:ABC transporter substrate-binding protein [Candidatus Ancillula sp.]